MQFVLNLYSVLNARGCLFTLAKCLGPSKSYMVNIRFSSCLKIRSCNPLYECCRIVVFQANSKVKPLGHCNGHACEAQHQPRLLLNLTCEHVYLEASTICSKFDHSNVYRAELDTSMDHRGT
ncbi:hypothetical protein VNO77_37703 [Canavalia gladiata]|uniref:Uncharacterized protein n=1 Tax=Canavalia gladiata TaxID=3824 RepID=A0AAN9KB38_CANGL